MECREGQDITPPSYSPYLDKELTGCLIDSAWISFVTRTLTTRQMLGRQEIVRELERIEKSEEINLLRQQQQSAVDLFIETALLDRTTPMETVRPIIDLFRNVLTGQPV